MNRRRPVLIDTDTASDDAVALIMALRSPAIEVKAITTVAGNVDLEQARRDALYTVELCGADVPVYPGASGPLQRKLEIADWFHGRDGLGDHGYRPTIRRASLTSAAAQDDAATQDDAAAQSDAAGRSGGKAPNHAVTALIEVAQATPGLEIITLGPLTNLALALQRAPELARWVSRCVVMGGAPCCEGNVTPAAEFNIWVDPEAARAVLLAGLPIEMIGWQLSRYGAALNEKDIREILALKSPQAEFAIRCNSTAAAAYHKQTGEYGIALPDPVAMAVLLKPEIKLEVSRHLIEVECHSELTRGMTIVDPLNVAGDPRNAAVWAEALKRNNPAEICWKLDVQEWKAMLLHSLR